MTESLVILNNDLTRDQDRDERPDFSQIVDELLEISDSMPSAKYTDVSDFLSFFLSSLIDDFYDRIWIQRMH